MNWWWTGPSRVVTIPIHLLAVCYQRNVSTVEWNKSDTKFPTAFSKNWNKRIIKKKARFEYGNWNRKYEIRVISNFYIPIWKHRIH